MGREIRRVPPNWKHPKTTRPNHLGVMEECYEPMFDEAFAQAMRKWIAGWEAWERGERPEYCSEESRNLSYWEWYGGPPDPIFYRPDWKPEEMTWWQVYETVSEGTPVTPPFATQQELVDYLVKYGDFWDQKRRNEGVTNIPCSPWSLKQAKTFVFGTGWAPSMIISGGKVMSGAEVIDAIGNNDL